MKIKYSKDTTIEAKSLISKHQPINNIWRRQFAPSISIGNCTNLYRILDPNDYEDFFYKYIKYAENNKHLNIYNRGLTEEELISMVNRYMTLGNSLIEPISYPFETYLNDALCHIITETYDGKNMEKEFIMFLRKLGYKCEYFDGAIDTKYGVDIKVIRSDNKVSAIQIKPISFFTSKRTDTHKDRIGLVKKYYECLKDFNIKTYYAIYKKDKVTNEVLWLKNVYGFRFRINELFDYNIDDIDNTLKFKFINNLIYKKLNN